MALSALATSAIGFALEVDEAGAASLDGQHELLEATASPLPAQAQAGDYHGPMNWCWGVRDDGGSAKGHIVRGANLHLSGRTADCVKEIAKCQRHNPSEADKIRAGGRAACNYAVQLTGQQPPTPAVCVPGGGYKFTSSPESFRYDTTVSCKNESTGAVARRTLTSSHMMTACYNAVASACREVGVAVEACAGGSFAVGTSPKWSISTTGGCGHTEVVGVYLDLMPGFRVSG